MDKSNRAFVIGHPIAHSRSPLIHGHWLEEFSINGAYEKHDVHPSQLQEFLTSIRRGQWLGGNVTIPHKQALLSLVDHVTPEARQIGAANTVWAENGKLHATNTDAYGFAANLDDFAPQWRNAENSLVIGAGGASRAVIQACISAGHKTVTVVNRTEVKAKSLAEEFGCTNAAYANTLQDTHRHDVIINTTSAGMGNIPPLPINFASARADAVACDIVYSPLNTPFLVAAREHGLTTVDGIGMLIHQAVPGFEIWFTKKPQVTSELRTLLLRDLGETG
ncbi:MAG: shikimate dehydrogenase [Pseudomonadota bacterium]